MESVVDRVVRHLDAHDPGGVLGLYLYGSAVTGGLRPDSDLDLLVVTERSLPRDARAELVDLLLQFSGRRATAVPGRPVEVTSVVRGDVVPWHYPPVCDFQYGEWLRPDFVAGHLPERHVSPDLAVLLTTVQQHVRVLRGPEPADLLALVPVTDLRRALLDSLGPLLADLVGDERNVLLTLARMTVTLETGDIVPKDQAARRLLAHVPEPGRSLLELAADGYLGAVEDDWSAQQVEVRVAAEQLAARVRAHRGP